MGRLTTTVCDLVGESNAHLAPDLVYCICNFHYTVAIEYTYQQKAYYLLRIVSCYIFVIPRPSVPQLGKLLIIAFEMVFTQNNENLLVAVIRFQIITTRGVKSRILRRLVRQIP